MSQYYLMNKDTKLLEFEIIDSIFGEEIKETRTFLDLRPKGFSNISTWLEVRNYAKHKEHFKRWLSEWNIDTVKGFIDITHCLGINDTLWVKSIDSSLKWSEINLYHNEFTDVAQKTAFETGLYGLQLSSTEIISPEFTSDGTAPKCWKVEDDKIYLYKSCLKGASNLGKEAYSEFISSAIARQLVVNESIPYELVMFKDNLCSKCELFTNEKYGYVPFYKYINSQEKHTLKNVLDILSKMGYEEKFRKMILIDSIIFNQDRHLGNFGFLVDNDTFEIVDFAPFFDYNLSMLCNGIEEDISSISNFEKYEEEYLLGHKLGGKFSDIGKAILTPTLKEIIPKNIDFPIHDQYNMSSERLDCLMDILNYNIFRITDSKLYSFNFQNAFDIPTIKTKSAYGDIEEYDDYEEDAPKTMKI